MKLYDMKCPVCGHINHNLYLEETEGWMECEKCRNTSRSITFCSMIRFPALNVKESFVPAVAAH